MNSSTKNEAKSARDIAYYTQRYRNRVFAAITKFVSEQAQEQGLTQKDVAERIKKDPAFVSRVLRHPTNLTLDTISELLLAFDAEADPPRIVLFRDRPQANYMHPLIARVLNVHPASSVTNTQSANSGEKVISSREPKVKAEFSVASGAG